MDRLNNILPSDGIVYYYGVVLSEKDATYYFDQLLAEIDWSNDEIMMFGKKVVTKRKVAWYGDNGIAYTYSKVMKQALEWTPLLLSLKELVEGLTNEKYNSCLLNLYHNGNEGMGWHSDNEKEMKKDGSICSLSLGAERRFDLRHQSTGETISTMLQNGSLLEMKGVTQKHWKHQLAKTSKVLQPRINLTFRTIVTI